jgi:TolB-like protein/Flp pilus assembly protein TadD
MADNKGVQNPSQADGQAPNHAEGAASAPVFISYASHDADTLNVVCQYLESRCVLCWIAPRDVKAGAQYADAIVRAINEAKAVVLVMSASALASSHVGREVERAASKNKPIIVFRIDAVPLNPALEYFLSQSQWIDVPTLGMAAALMKVAEAVGHVSVSSPQAVTVARAGGIRRRGFIVAAVILLIGMGIALGSHFWNANHGAAQPTETSAISDKSIAVLPFVDMSEKKDQEYFADGMAEEIIDLLVKIPGLKVISRTSSFQFKGKTQDLRSIGTQLGAAYVLEGSVRQSGERLRVTAQLIDSRDGAHLFSQTYDRELSDVLKMQDEIADTLVRALQIEVGPEGIVSRPALRNTAAYTLYLQGKHAFDRFDQPGFEQAAIYFQRALDLDPSFAVAACMLAAAYMVLGEWGFITPTVAFESARRAEQLALKLDPKLADAHAGLGRIYGVYDWDWSAADRELKMAQALAPNDARILFMTALQSLSTGHWDEALRLVNASLAQDPLNPSGYFVLYQAQLRRGRLSEAETAIRRTLAISPTFSRARYSLGIVLLARNQRAAALAEMLKEGDDAGRLGGSAIAHFALGHKGESDAALAQMLKSQSDQHPFLIAQVYAFRGESNEALKWLDRAFTQKEASLEHIKGEPTLKNLEGDARYRAFLGKLNLPE